MDLIFTRTVIIPADTSARKVIKSMTEQGYTLTGVKDENHGDFVGICEICETPIFSDDEYHTDENGTCWHKICDGEVSCDE